MNFIAISKYIMIIFNLFNNILLNNKISLIEYKSYKITLKIKGIGFKRIFSSSFFGNNNDPDDIYINGLKQKNVGCLYNLNKADNLIELIWNNLINDCGYMFDGCSYITEIDFSNFGTSRTTKMNNMFSGCSSLILLNLLNFETSKVSNMDNMFAGCSSLTSLNLSNFNTSEVEIMENMFSDCSSLTSLNLSNFNTSKVTKISQMFDGCVNLEYINMINFNEIKLDSQEHKYIFKNVSNNIVVCINKNNIQYKIYPQILNISCHIEDCSENWKLNKKKFIKETNECVNNCLESEQYKYDYNGKCYPNCSNGYYNDSNNIMKCKCELENCLTCTTVSLNKGLCTQCNYNYYPLGNNPLNIGEYFNCYNETPIGYYLEINDLLYKKCYFTCETCETKGDNIFHNCLKCNDEYNIEIDYNNYVNCFKNCNYYYYFDNDNNYHCTENE